jgi:hypothetical protein
MLPARPARAQAPEPLERYVAGLDEPVLELVRKAMEADPEKRFQSAAEMIAALDQAGGAYTASLPVAPLPWEDETSSVRSPAAAVPPGEPVPAAGMMGLFTRLELFELFQLIEQTGKTGQLKINDPPGNAGVVVVREGKVLRAEYRGHSAGAAILALLELEEGFFRLLTQPVDEPCESPLAISPLLMEAARRQDELLAAPE